MKKTVTLLLALTLCLPVMSVDLGEGVPAPAGRWSFDDATNLLKCDEGSLTLTPAVIPGNKQISLVETLAEANIKEAPAAKTAVLMEGNRALEVPAASALMLSRAEDATATRNYTIMIDFMVDAIGPFHSFYQTSQTNANDGDFFMQEDGKLGITAMGGYSTRVCKAGQWYRLMIVNKDQTLRGYLDGQEIIVSGDGKWAGRWEIDPWGFYLFCDEDGEDATTYVAEVAYWEQPLTAEQIVEYGNFEKNEYLIPNPETVKLYNEEFFSISVDANVDLKFTCPSWIVPVDVTPVIGAKDYTFRTKGQSNQTGNIVITGGELEKTVTVQQSLKFGVPEATGTWDFNDANDLLKCQGSLEMLPAIIPEANKLEFVKTAADAGIKDTTGIADGDKAIYLPPTAVLQVVRGEGALVPTPYFTLMMDVKVPRIAAESGRHYNALLQTQVDNNDADGDLFIRDGKVGLGGKLGYGGKITAEKWHRIVFENNNKEVSVFIDGKKVKSTTSINAQWCLQEAFNLFCDNDFPPEDDEICVTEVRYWELPLTAEQIRELGDVEGKQPVHIGSTGFATFCSDECDVTIDGVDAYVVEVQGDYAVLTEKVNPIRAKLPVLLVGAEGDYEAVPTTGGSNFYTDLHSAYNTDVFDSAVSVLAEVDGVVGFYQAEVGTVIPAGKGFLLLPELASSSGGVKAIRFATDETGISTLPTDAAEKSNVIFDLTGRRVDKSQKGVYMING